MEHSAQSIPWRVKACPCTWKGLQYSHKLRMKQLITLVTLMAACSKVKPPEASCALCIIMLKSVASPTYGLACVGSPVMRPVNLYQDMVTTDNNVSTEKAIIGDVVDSMCNPHAAQDACDIMLVLLCLTGLHILRESLHTNTCHIRDGGESVHKIKCRV